MKDKTLTVLSVLTLLFTECKKNPDTNVGCAFPALVPFQPYSYPVWHPKGQLLGFNHTPLVSISTSGTAPCAWYNYMGNSDSTGFYLINKDGTGFKRVTNFRLSAPAWSPDGKWLAFSLGPNIYKMPFTGGTFDTTQIVPLTTNGGNFFPSWTVNSDTVYYDSNAGTNGAGYYIWKMASDGSGKTGYPNTGRQPFVANNKVYYIGLGQEIFSINKDGTNQTQFSNNGFAVERPKYWQGRLFYEGNQIGVILAMGSRGMKLVSPAVTYDISNQGEIVYSKMDYEITKFNKQIGTLWIMNADGSNNRQLTFNNF